MDDNARQSYDHGPCKDEEAPYGDGLEFYVQEEWPKLLTICG